MSEVQSLDPTTAKMMIQTLAGEGQPPRVGLEYITVGLDAFLKPLHAEYIGPKGTLKAGHGTVKIVEAYYGGGKTHFFRMLQSLAWKENFASSYVELSSKECPFNRLERVYQQLVATLQYPPREGDPGLADQGIEPFLRVWKARVEEELAPLDDAKTSAYLSGIQGIESVSFLHAVRAAFQCLRVDDDVGFNDVLQWLKGEGYNKDRMKPLSILEKLGGDTALRLMRSLVQWIRAIGYSGILLFLDEGERSVCLGSSKDKREAMNNLVKLINEVPSGRWPGVMLLYSVPDIQQFTTFAKGSEVDALRQRIEKVFTHRNPLHPLIRLEDLAPTDEDKAKFLCELGKKLCALFEVAYGPIQHPDIEGLIREKALHCLEVKADMSHRRDFVKEFLGVLAELRPEDPPP